MTRGEIISLACGRADFQGNLAVSRTLMNLAIERLTLAYKWEHMKQEVPITIAANQLVYSLPSDFVRVEMIKINSIKDPLRQLTRDQFNRMYPEDQRPIGRPSHYMVDEQKNTFVNNVDPITGLVDTTTLAKRWKVNRYPDTSYPGILVYYYRIPQLSTVDTNAYDANTTPFEDNIMQEAMTYQIYDYLDDARAASQWSKVDYIVREYMTTNYDMDAKQDVIARDPETFL